jgi:hypothetical protein
VTNFFAPVDLGLDRLGVRLPTPACLVRRHFPFAPTCACEFQWQEFIRQCSDLVVPTRLTR